MNDSSDLPREVAQTVDTYVDSLVGLEVLLLLYREPDRAWAAEQAADQLHIPAGAARRELDHMVSSGLASADSASQVAFHFHPADPERTRAVQVIVQAYGSRRIALINHVASGALQRIRTIADAFRLKKDGGHE